MRTLNKEELKFISKRVSDSKSRAKKKDIPHDVTKYDESRCYREVVLARLRIRAREP